MRFIDKKAVRELTSVSIQHITRLESEGMFPKRIRLTAGSNVKGQATGRVVWVYEEVLEWMRKRIEKPLPYVNWKERSKKKEPPPK